MPKIYVQHPAVGKKLLVVVAMIPSIEELAETLAAGRSPQQIKVTIPPRSICSEAHRVFQEIYDWDVKKNDVSMHMWTEDNAALGGPWVVAGILDNRVVVLEAP